MCAKTLQPGESLSDADLRESLEVGDWIPLWSCWCCAVRWIVRSLPFAFEMVCGSWQEEWEKDRQGLPAMTGRVFYLAVFELIGEWARPPPPHSYECGAVGLECAPPPSSRACCSPPCSFQSNPAHCVHADQWSNTCEVNEYLR
jgi:hypothetical protein